ncbi:MAG: TIR domain-containing protein [Metamycoplasmataceae bacterium]
MKQILFIMPFGPKTISVNNETITINFDEKYKELKNKIISSSIFLCIVGKDTHSSGWVEWEVKQAIALKKKIIFMRRKDDFTSSLPSKWINNPAKMFYNGAFHEVSHKPMIIDWDIELLKKF